MFSTIRASPTKVFLTTLALSKGIRITKRIALVTNRAKFSNFFNVVHRLDEQHETPKKPNQSYLEIIAEAILKAPNRMMQLYEIYNYFKQKYAIRSHIAARVHTHTHTLV